MIIKVFALSNDKNDFERIEFITSNPFSFFHIITDLEKQKSQNAYGLFGFSKVEIKNKYPLILGVNGGKN